MQELLQQEQEQEPEPPAGPVLLQALLHLLLLHLLVSALLLLQHPAALLPLPLLLLPGFQGKGTEWEQLLQVQVQVQRLQWYQRQPLLLPGDRLIAGLLLHPAGKG